MNLLVCYSEYKDKNMEFTNYFISLLKKYFSANIVIEEVGEIKTSDRKFDFAFSIGGDGTFLRVAHSVVFTPIVGVNLGRKGFLATIEKNNCEEAIKHLAEKKFTIKNKNFIQGTVNNQIIEAVNDITIGKKDFMRTVHLELYIDGSFVNTYICDGIVVSTAFGSTGYNRALNDVIAHPNSPIYIITPIASNDNLFKSLIVPSTSLIVIKEVKHASSSDAIVGFDGTQKIIDLENSLVISKSQKSFSTIEMDSFDYYENLRKKS